MKELCIVNGIKNTIIFCLLMVGTQLLVNPLAAYALSSLKPHSASVMPGSPSSGMYELKTRPSTWCSQRPSTRCDLRTSRDSITM